MDWVSVDLGFKLMWLHKDAQMRILADYGGDVFRLDTKQEDGSWRYHANYGSLVAAQSAGEAQAVDAAL